MYFLIVLGSLLLFVISERSFIHFSRTARRAFWYVLSCGIVLWVVKWLQDLEGVGMAWILFTAVLVASVMEDEYFQKTGLTSMDIEATSSIRLKYRTPEAQGKAERIMDIVNSITRGKGYTAGTKQLVARVSGATKRLQKGLHTILLKADSKELNYLLCTINVAAMVEVANEKTMQLLVTSRISCMETVSRAALVDGLQKLGLRHRRQRQEWVRDIIIKTFGVELTHFKAYIDDGGDYHSMYKLMYHDLQGDILKEVFDHIKSQGKALQTALKSINDEEVPRGIVLKILSDVDDTVFSSGASFPAGADSRYPRKCYYPGALALYSAIDRHFALKYGNYIERIKLELSDSVDLSNVSLLSSSLKSKDVLETPSQPNIHSRVHTANTSIPNLHLALHSTSNLPIYGQISPFGARSPEYSLLGDLMTPRDTISFPVRDTGMQGQIVRGSQNAHQEGSNLVLLSARPESYKGLTESDSYRKYFQPLVMRGDLATSPTMLLGSLDSGARALLKHFFGDSKVPHHPKSKTAKAALYQTLAAKKLSRFHEYAAIYPEAAFIYVGDNGQGDVLCAELISGAEEEATCYKEQLIASLIHRVIHPLSTLSVYRKEGTGREELQDAWRRQNIYLCRTHLGMAKCAYELDLISKNDISRIASSAVSEFKRIYNRYHGRHAGRNLEVAAKDLNADISDLNGILQGQEIPLILVPNPD